MASNTASALLYPERFLSPGWLVFAIGVVLKVCASAVGPALAGRATDPPFEVSHSMMSFFGGLSEIGTWLMAGGMLLIAVHAYHDRIDAREKNSSA